MILRVGCIITYDNYYGYKHKHLTILSKILGRYLGIDYNEIYMDVLSCNGISEYIIRINVDETRYNFLVLSNKWPLTRNNFDIILDNTPLKSTLKHFGL